MNAFLCYLSIAVFLVLPLLLFGLRYYRGRPAWWLIVLVLVVAGWASWIGATVFHFEALGDRIEADPHPAAQLVESWGRDSGPKTFAFLFGWAAAGVYSIGWYLMFLIACLLRRIVGSRRRSESLNIDILNRTALLAPKDRD